MRSQEEHFDAVADAYEETIRPHVMAHLTRRRVDLVCSLSASGRVLDVGCGTGRLLHDMPARYEKHGVDISDEMLAIARRRGLDVVHAGAADLPFDDSTFDVVTTFAVLHHLIDPELVRRAIHEMCRVVKPGGAVVVWDHNPLNPYWPLLMRRLPQDQGDEKLVPAKLIRSALSEAGMADIRLRRMTFVPDFTPALLLPAVAAVERVLERIPGLSRFGAHNVAVSRRPAA
jgi:ubiquinone/menaquinone biosynthesis C-methylase UbiE